MSDLGDLVSCNANGITVEAADLRELSHAEALELAAGLQRAADEWAALYSRFVTIAGDPR